MRVTKTIGDPPKNKRIKLLPISDCWQCTSKFEDGFSSFCGRTEEPNKEKRTNCWGNKELPSREGKGIPKWCPLKDKKDVRRKKV